MTQFQPLWGKRVVITRPESQAGSFKLALESLGAIPILFPTIALVPIQDHDKLDQTLLNLSAFDWVIFTSANGVRYVLDRLTVLGINPEALNKLNIAVIGPNTAAALTANHVHVDVQPEQFVAESLFNALQTHSAVEHQRYLLLRAEVARPMLRDALTANGAFVEDVPVYRTVIGTPALSAMNQIRSGTDVFTFTSPLTATYFCQLLGDDATIITRDKLAACIGPITFDAVTGTGLPFQNIISANEFTVRGLIATLTEYYQTKQENI